MSLTVKTLVCLIVTQLIQTACASSLYRNWKEGRATWFEHPHTGSCGYGHLDKNFWMEDEYFSVDAVAALPDVHPMYSHSCGLCFEIKCRGIQAVAADGSVDLDRYDACYNTNETIVIKIVDTCPCVGNEQWCCGGDPKVKDIVDHLDLSKEAFGRLASPGKGIIGLHLRPVPCAKKFRALEDSDWEELTEEIKLGASPKVFMNGKIYVGWEKTVYGDKLRSMYTYNPSVKRTEDGSKALCTEIERYGGFDFHSQKVQIDTIAKSKSIEFWVKSSDDLAEITFMANNLFTGGCWPKVRLMDGDSGVEVNGWRKFVFDTSMFICPDKNFTADVLNRLHWENTGERLTSLCVKEININM